jgi:branched-subunit amino acid transport protein
MMMMMMMMMIIIDIFAEVTITWPSRLVSYLYSESKKFESRVRHWIS